MTRSRSRLVRALLLLALLAPSLALRSPATVGQDAPAVGAMIPELNLGDFGGGANPQVNYNPYAANRLGSVTGLIYEPLYVINGYSCAEQPWLATSYQWLDDKTLTFTLRGGVVWSDGQPLTADDVAFTFNLLKQFPALDYRGIGQFITGVTAAAPMVTFTFAETAYPLLGRVVENEILPRHAWESIEDPVTFTNDAPVGSGPFLPEAFNGQQLTMARNPAYWQAEKVRVERLVYSKNTGGNQVEQLKIAEGEYDLSQTFLPDVENTFVARDPENNKYWYPSGGLVSLYLNLTKEPFNDPAFRQAVAHAIDRQEIADRAQNGYVTTASQTGLVLPNRSALLDPTIPNEGRIPYDLARAEQILTEAGYTRDGEGRLVTPSGNAVEFSFIVPGDFTDWLAAAQIIVEDLRAIGVTMNIQTVTPDVMSDDRRSGNYDAVFDVFGGGCNTYFDYFLPFSSTRSAPIGEQTPDGGNHERWEDPETDQLLQQLRVAPDAQAQLAPLHGLQQILYTELPVISLWYGAIWYQYRTENAEGWPSAENPYALPGQPLLIFTTLVPPGEGQATP